MSYLAATLPWTIMLYHAGLPMYGLVQLATFAWATNTMVMYSWQSNLSMLVVQNKAESTHCNYAQEVKAKQ